MFMINIFLIVHVSLAQLVGTIHNICKVRGLNSSHHKKKKKKKNWLCCVCPSRRLPFIEMSFYLVYATQEDFGQDKHHSSCNMTVQFTQTNHANTSKLNKWCAIKEKQINSAA